MQSTPVFILVITTISKGHFMYSFWLYWYFYWGPQSYWQIRKTQSNIQSEQLNLTCIFFSFSSRLRRISSIGITNAKVLPLPVTWERKTESAPSAPHTEQENQPERTTLTASAATSLLLMKSGMVADWGRKKEKQRINRLIIIWQRLSYPREPPEFPPSFPSGGTVRKSDRSASSHPRPGASFPGLPVLRAAPSPAPGSCGRSRGPVTPAARPGSAARAAKTNRPQSPPPSWRGRA